MEVTFKHTYLKENTMSPFQRYVGYCWLGK